MADAMVLTLTTTAATVPGGAAEWVPHAGVADVSGMHHCGGGGARLTDGRAELLPTRPRNVLSQSGSGWLHKGGR